MNRKIDASRTELQVVLETFCQQQGEELERLARQLASLFASGGQLLLAGNGSFQPLVQLLAGHFAYRLGFDRPVLPAVALGSDPVLSAVMTNRGEQDQRLVRHYRALNGREQYLLILSDGSLSPALRALRDEVLDAGRPVALLAAEGREDALCRDGVEICIGLETAQPARQLELSLFAGQLLCELVESELFGV